MLNWIFKLNDWLSPALGGGGSTNTTTQKSDPWSGVQPYLTDYLQKGQATTSQPYNFYNGDTVAGFAPEQQLGMQLGTQRALAGSPTLNAANQNATDTLNGNYLSPDSNPYLRQNVNSALNDVQTRVNSQFSGNNYGGSANQELLTKNLADTASQMYGQNYTNERNNQMQAGGMAPTLAGADYMDPTYLQGIGAQRQGLANQYLGNSATQYNNAAQFPYEQLQRYGNVVSGGTGQGGTSTMNSPNPNQSNPIAGGIGGAASGYALGGAIGGAANGATFGPWGAAIGGALGLLSSDARLKSNIVKVGDHHTGVGIYEYDKFGKRERGVMAQEVEKVMPEAVFTHPQGYKMVAYGLLN